MAEVTLTLRFNRTTGQREIVVGYEGDADALPHEHERDHRALAEALLGQPLDGLLGGVTVDRVIVERAPRAGEAAAEEAQRAPNAEREPG